MRILRRLIGYLALGMALIIMATAAIADGKLSKDHLLYGVSQFIAGQVTRSQAGPNTPLKLFNPTPTTQVVASLFYVRENEGQGDSSFEGDDEGGADFQGCRVSVLRPHSAVQINLDFLARIIHEWIKQKP